MTHIIYGRVMGVLTKVLYDRYNKRLGAEVKARKKMKKLTTNEWVERARKVHGNRYDYSKVEYVNTGSHVIIICPEHGDFEQTPAHHVIRGQGCPFCKGKLISNSLTKHHNLNKDWNFEQPEDYKLIPLTQGKFAMVDNEDFDKVKGINWYYSKGYGTNDTYGRIHNYIMPKLKKGLLYDHEDGNRLDNRKSNLREATHQENCWNSKPRGITSSFKGVNWYPNYGKWRVRVFCDGKEYSLGYYENEVEGAKAYDLKAIELFGEFARLNFPESKEEYLEIIRKQQK